MDGVIGIEMLMVQHIYNIAYNAINKKERPIYLSRSNCSCNLSTGLDEPVKPKNTRSAKSKPF